MQMSPRGRNLGCFSLSGGSFLSERRKLSGVGAWSLSLPEGAGEGREGGEAALSPKPEPTQRFRPLWVGTLLGRGVLGCCGEATPQTK